MTRRPPAHPAGPGGRPASANRLRERAWAAVIDRDGGPVTAGQIADAAGITCGAAATFMTEWARAGRVRAGQPPAGSYAAYSIPYTAPLAPALAAAARGWHVLPLRPDNKRPAFPDHTADRCTGRDPWCRDGHQGWEPRATTDPDRIRRAWSSRPYGIGVACGPSGLLVVDLDEPKPDTGPPPQRWRMDGVSNGSDVLAVLAEEAGQPFPADTYSVRTGRGGTHLYFARPAGVRLGNTAGDRGGLGWLIDTRGTGGYVVAAGSTVDGRSYGVLAGREPAPLPDWIVDRLRPADHHRPAGPAAVSISAGRVPAYVRAAVAAETELVRTTTEGRNNALYCSSIALGQLVAGGALSAELATAELEQAALSAGLTPREVASTIRSGLRAGAGRPRRPGQAVA